MIPISAVKALRSPVVKKLTLSHSLPDLFDHGHKVSKSTSKRLNGLHFEEGRFLNKGSGEEMLLKICFYSLISFQAHTLCGGLIHR